MLLVLVLVLVIFCQPHSYTQESPLVKGQFSTFINYSSENNLPVLTGARYIPQLNLNFPFINNLLDFEFSANLNGMAGFSGTDSSYTDGRIKPYRIWVRYSNEQFEIRAGLQKINFGSASMLRPLMWFDRVDPRDPLQLTEGVWGLLGRYYFLDNTNIWLWALYGNEDEKTWEISKTNSAKPEFGGRIQLSLFGGEAGISYHYRKTDMSGLSPQWINLSEVSENRFGIDGKWDVEAGLWFEAAVIKREADLGLLSSQEMICAGTDYTFDYGNGLNVIAEHLLAGADSVPLRFLNTRSFTALSASYPVDIFDRVSGIAYYDWKGKEVYTFANWQMTWDNISLNLIAFFNPEISNLPQANDKMNLMGGNGVQIVFVYNH